VSRGKGRRGRGELRGDKREQIPGEAKGAQGSPREPRAGIRASKALDGHCKKEWGHLNLNGSGWGQSQHARSLSLIGACRDHDGGIHEPILLPDLPGSKGRGQRTEGGDTQGGVR